MTIEADIKEPIEHIGTDIKALASRIGHLERHLAYMTPATIERSEPDQDGVYKKIIHKRKDGTVMQISIIEHDPLIEIVNGLYNKRVVTIYNKLGTAITDTITYQIKYDANGVLVSETLL